MGEKSKAGVSLMAGEIVEEIKNIDGFCTKKFKADIVTEGVDYEKLSVGDLLELGDKKVRISRVGKPCFADCPVENKPCILNHNVAFGEYE